jgi:hypothetical protein
VVGLYLAASASEPPAPGKKPSAVRTIERRLSAIAWNCAQYGQPLDRADRHIAEVMSGIRRRHARAWSRPSTTVCAACATARSC